VSKYRPAEPEVKPQKIKTVSFVHEELCLRQVRHQPKKRCYSLTLEVPEGLGARIMDYAAMVSGLSPWDVSKLLDGGLRLTERGTDAKSS